MSLQGNESEKPVAIITGAGRGIGRAIARMLNQTGFAMTLVSRNEAELRETAAACDDALIVPADITADADVAGIVESTLGRFGAIDVLINNAGYAPMLSIEQTSVSEFRRIIEVNLTAAFALCRGCWSTFVARKSGVIVNISSMAAKDPLPGFCAYGAAKAGLNTLGLALAREGAAHGISVHTIAPGAVETGMFRSLVDEKTWPKSQTLDPEDVARVVQSCVRGDIEHTSGETIYIKRNP